LTLLQCGLFPEPTSIATLYDGDDPYRQDGRECVHSAHCRFTIVGCLLNSN